MKRNKRVNRFELSGPHSPGPLYTCKLQLQPRKRPPVSIMVELVYIDNVLPGVDLKTVHLKSFSFDKTQNLLVNSTNDFSSCYK